jgi:hypothetical protein
MAEFSLEIYAASDDADGVAVAAGRAARTAAEVTAMGTPVHFIRSVFLPADETCFFLFEAVSSDAVEEVGRRAQLPFDRVAEAVTASIGGDTERSEG